MAVYIRFFLVDVFCTDYLLLDRNKKRKKKKKKEEKEEDGK